MESRQLENKTSKTLSKNKQEFLTHQDTTPYSITHGLPVVALHYWEKGIPIIPYGSTPKNHSFILNEKNKYDEWLALIDKYPIATFVIDNWKSNDSYDLFIYGASNPLKLDISLFSKFSTGECKEIAPLMKNFYRKTGIERKFRGRGIKDSISTGSMSISEENLCQLEKDLLNLRFRDKILGFIEPYKNILRSQQENISLSWRETLAEVLDIQKSLQKKNDDSFVGYLLNANQKVSIHVDTLLISKDIIIRTPYCYSSSSISQMYLFAGLDTYNSNLDSFVPKEYQKNTLPSPQADRLSCASLGFATTKKLLKNDAYELKNHTLHFKLYDDDGELCSFFLTSPETLQYSQSSTYNNLLKNIVESDEDRIKIPAKEQNEEYYVYSLKKALENSQKIAIEKGDNKTFEENAAILKKLPAFREKWIKSFNNMTEHRNQFNHNHNLSLQYRVKKYEKMIKASESKKERDSVVTELSEKVGNYLLPRKNENDNYEKKMTRLENQPKTIDDSLSSSKHSFFNMEYLLASLWEILKLISRSFLFISPTIPVQLFEDEVNKQSYKYPLS